MNNIELKETLLSMVDTITENELYQKELIEMGLLALRYKALFYNKDDLLEKINKVIENNTKLKIERSRGWGTSNREYMSIYDTDLTDDEKEFCKEFNKSIL